MNFTKIAKLLPAAGVACLLSLPALAQTSPSNAPAASGTMAPMAPMAPATSNAMKPAKSAKTSGLPANEHFSTVAAATSHCPGGTVEWSAMSHSKTYHASGSKYYGKTKHGAYACKSDLDAAGFHQSKN